MLSGRFSSGDLFCVPTRPRVRWTERMRSFWERKFACIKVVILAKNWGRCQAEHKFKPHNVETMFRSSSHRLHEQCYLCLVRLMQAGRNDELENNADVDALFCSKVELSKSSLANAHWINLHGQLQMETSVACGVLCLLAVRTADGPFSKGFMQSRTSELFVKLLGCFFLSFLSFFRAKNKCFDLLQLVVDTEKKLSFNRPKGSAVNKRKLQGPNKVAVFLHKSSIWLHFGIRWLSRSLKRPTFTTQFAWIFFKGIVFLMTFVSNIWWVLFNPLLFSFQGRRLRLHGTVWLRWS